jgi:site-specific DNA recombinase
MRHLAIDDVESAVIDHYATLRLPSGFAKRVRAIMDATLSDDQATTRLMHDHLTATLAALDRKEENLLDLVAEGGTVGSKVRARLAAIGEERARALAELAEIRPALDAGAAVVRSALDLLEDPQELYRQTSDRIRRQLNQVFFDRLYVDMAGVTDDALAAPFHDFVARPRLTRPSYERKRPTGHQHEAAPRRVPRDELLPTCSNTSRVTKVGVRQQWWS